MYRLIILGIFVLLNSCSPDTGADTDANTGTDTDTDVDTESDIDAAADTGGDTVSDMDTGIDTGEPNIIADQVSEVTAIEVVANLQDGYYEFEEESWTLDIASGLLVYEYVLDYEPVEDRHVEELLTPDERDSIVNEILSVPWRGYGDCFGTFIDGSPTPPSIVITDADGNHRYSVSDAECAISDHSAMGPVVSCSDYADILDTLTAFISSAGAPTCASYW